MKIWMNMGRKPLALCCLCCLTGLMALPLKYGFQRFPQHQPVAVQDPNFTQQWLQVDSLEQKGLTEEALEEVKQILSAARVMHAQPHILKALLYQSKYRQQLEEGGMEKTIADFEQETQTADYPLKAILQSCTAELYWSYFLQNRWIFYNRTKVTGVKLDDVTTWDLFTLLHKVRDLYGASVSEADSLKKVPVSRFDVALLKGFLSESYMPNLFDLLAHRAFQFYANAESSMSEIADTEPINSFQGFMPFYGFSQTVLPPTDTSNHWMALRLCQQLIREHIADNNNNALVFADLDRVALVHSVSADDQRDSLYMQYLVHLGETFGVDTAAAPVLYHVALLCNEQAAQYKPLEGDEHKWDRVRATAYCETVINRFPHSMWMAAARNLEQQILQPALQAQAEGVNEPGKPFRLLLQYANAPHIYYRICKVSGDLNRQMGSYNNSQIDSLLQKLPYDKQYAVTLPDDEDHQDHLAELAMPALPAGNYAILLCDQEFFNAKNKKLSYVFVQVSGLAMLAKRNVYDEGLRYTPVYTLNRATGQPMAGVKIIQFTTEYNYKKRIYEKKRTNVFTSDAEGYAAITNASSDYSNYNLELVNGSDTMNNAESYYGSYYANRGSEKPYTTISIFTDRSIYRPGQTLHFKAMVLEHQGTAITIKPGYATRIRLLDVNSQQVAELTLSTNEFGTIAGSFQLPDNGLNGTMYLQTDNGTTPFSVEEYKRPHFEVSFDTLRGDYHLGEPVTVKGIAKDYNGAAVSGAKVHYVVRRTTYQYDYYHDLAYGSYLNSTQVAIGDQQSGDDGSFLITFTAAPDRSAGKETTRNYVYTVNADVTDITGEMHSATTNTHIGYCGLTAQVAMPGVLHTDSAQKISVYTQNLNGVRTPALLHLQVMGLHTPEQFIRPRKWEEPDRHLLSAADFRVLFPQEEYAHETNPEQWQETGVVYQTTLDTKQQTYFSTEPLMGLAPGAYELLLTGQDKDGRPFSLKRIFAVFASRINSAPEPVLVMSDRSSATATVGDTLHWDIASSEDNLPVLVEYQWQQLNQHSWMTLHKGINRLTIPVKAAFLHNFSVQVMAFRYNDYQSCFLMVNVPDHAHELVIRTKTFRNKLEPDKSETWSFSISGYNGNAAAAELMAAMYDASLDALQPQKWNLNLYADYNYYDNWSAPATGLTPSFAVYNESYFFAPPHLPVFDRLNWFGLVSWYYSVDYYSYRYTSSNEPMKTLEDFEPDTPIGGTVNTHGVVLREAADDATISGDRDDQDAYLVDGVKLRGNTSPATGWSPDSESKDARDGKPDQSGAPVMIRKNLQETAFFFPQLHTDDQGAVSFTFQTPEALTQWKLMLMAHTKDLQLGFSEMQVVTQKQLMVQPNAPRFLREGDDLFFSAKISNLSDSAIHGAARLEFFDAATNAPLNLLAGGQQQAIPFQVAKGLNTVAIWHVQVPQGLGMVGYRVTAVSNIFSDGEENILPVLSNRMLVNETVPLWARGMKTSHFVLPNLLHDSSGTKTNFKLTLEACSNPAWYAVQALPYIMEYPYECAEQTFERYYANALATEIANSNPGIQQVFDNWKSKDELLSALDKNEELKTVLLQETPWVQDARDETAEKKRLGLLFDLNKMAKELRHAEVKLNHLQASNGGFPWFEGMPDDPWVTLYIVTGFGHLQKLGVAYQKETMVNDMLTQAVGYLDQRFVEAYQELLKYKADLSQDHLSSFVIQYLYARSFFHLEEPDMDLYKTALSYFADQETKFWQDKSLYEKAMMALSLSRSHQTAPAMGILKSLKENTIDDPEKGMYWKQNRSSYDWWGAPVETQSLLIEAFAEVGNDPDVDEMKVWLLSQKHTQNWETTTATANACYALLLGGSNWLTQTPDLTIQLGHVTVQSAALPDSMKEAGTGHFKESWTGQAITADMGDIRFSTSSKVPAWGGVYYQYFEALDKIKQAATPLSLKKQLFIQENDGSKNILVPISDSSSIHTGDIVVVRLELRCDRDVDYVHMKDMRAAGLEPMEVISGYRWQDGLGYYESPGDAATHFFFDHLSMGTYVFEYRLRANLRGNFSNGITQIECMYAPEFTSHSEGIRITIDK